MSAEDRQGILRVSGLTAGYDDLMVLDGLDVVVEDGMSTAVLGPNGAGKTTLMRAIAGELPAVEGQIHFLDRDITRTPSHARLKEIGWAPEGRLLFSDFSVRDNLFLSARAAGRAREFRDALEECMDLFPVLKQKLRATAGSLSGGQQQMVAIARAIVRRPRLLLLDEPSMGLAPLVIQDIRNALGRLKEGGLSILLTEQNVPWLEGLVDSVVILLNGRVATQGSSELLDDRDAVRSIYLG